MGEIKKQTRRNQKKKAKEFYNFEKGNERKPKCPSSTVKEKGKEKYCVDEGKEREAKKRNRLEKESKS